MTIEIKRVVGAAEVSYLQFALELRSSSIVRARACLLFSFECLHCERIWFQSRLKIRYTGFLCLSFKFSFLLIGELQMLKKRMSLLFLHRGIVSGYFFLLLLWSTSGRSFIKMQISFHCQFFYWSELSCIYFFVRKSYFFYFDWLFLSIFF